MILEHIARETGVSAAAIEAIVNSADRLYKTYRIKKRTVGFRQINHPTPTLKFLQRWVARNVIVHLPVHPSVTSYKKGVGIGANAHAHASRKYLMKMDFRDFFPSITKDDVRRLLEKNIALPKLMGLEGNDVELIAKIVCKSGRLTIGAPSSPSISNAVLFDFDNFISNECEKRQVRYSRYADDLSFSSNAPNVLSVICQVVGEALVEQPFPRLTVNEEKTVFTSKKGKRRVTGLVLSSTDKISIGREKKRELKTLCYLFSEGKLVPDKASYLRGYLAYVRSVEPTFVENLRRKFGAEIMQQIMGAPLIQRKPPY